MFSLSKKSNYVLASVIVLVVTGALCYMLWNHAELKRSCTEQVPGIVKSIERESGDHYRAIFAYSVKGVEYVVRSPISSNSLKFSQGDSVTVFYDPANPQRYYVLEEEGMIMVFAIALLVIIAGGALIIFMVFWNKWKRRRVAE